MAKYVPYRIILQLFYNIVKPYFNLFPPDKLTKNSCDLIILFEIE